MARTNNGTNKEDSLPDAPKRLPSRDPITPTEIVFAANGLKAPSPRLTDPYGRGFKATSLPSMEDILHALEDVERSLERSSSDLATRDDGESGDCSVSFDDLNDVSYHSAHQDSVSSMPFLVSYAGCMSVGSSVWDSAEHSYASLDTALATEELRATTCIASSERSTGGTSTNVLQPKVDSMPKHCEDSRWECSKRSSDCSPALPTLARYANRAA